MNFVENAEVGGIVCLLWKSNWIFRVKIKEYEENI